MRIFISININESVKKIISNIQDKLKKDISEIDHNLLKFIKWEAKNKFHITLLFIGDVNELRLSEISHQLTEMNSKLKLDEIKFEFGNINAFPNMKSPRVLMLELFNEDNKVFSLFESINSSLKKLGIESDKSFQPHITLGRVKRDKKLILTKLNTELNSNVKFSVNEFYVMESKLLKTGSEFFEVKKFVV